MEGVFVMVVLIVLIGCLTGVASDYLKTKRKVANGLLGDVEAELNDLRERVRVLEEIVTERNYPLREELDRL